MGRPGSGRYTTYLPTSNPSKRVYLNKLFKGGMSALYEGATTNAEAATAAVNRAVTELSKGIGDVDLFGNGVSMKFENAPDTTTVEWKNPGDPANPYVPDLSSPGPGKTEGVDKDTNPQIETTDIKPKFDPSNPTVNTTSPSATSERLGTFSLGENLEGGKSSLV
jgi:hypothetical protein